MGKTKATEELIIRVGERVLGRRVCSGSTNGLGGGSRSKATNTTSRSESSAVLPLSLSLSLGLRTTHRCSPTAGEDLVPKPAGQGAQSEQEETAAAAAAAAPAATTASPRNHPPCRWAAPGGPVPQLRWPPGGLLPNASQGGVSALAPCPALWAGGLGTPMLGMWLLSGRRRPCLSPSPVPDLLSHLGRVTHPAPVCAFGRFVQGALWRRTFSFSRPQGE